jgi:hypothetical protein
MPLLTKSKYLYGLQCPKLLWVAINDKDKLPEPDAATQALFDSGHEVGNLAKKLFPGGVDIPTSTFMGNIKKSKARLRLRKPLFEAGFMAKDVFARADILNPVDGAWDIIEVKSSTKVKDINLHDLSFQKYCYMRAGLKIGRCFLMYINREYVRNGPIDPKEFFIIEDVTDKVLELFKDVSERVEGMLKIASRKEHLDVDITPKCSDPYDCALKSGCWSHLSSDNVFNLYRGGEKCFSLYNSGVKEIKDIPDSFKLNDKQEIQRKCAKSGEVYLEKDKIKEFLSKLTKPLYYLDFETFSTAIPLLDGLKPYEQVPFQFSLHVFQFSLNEEGKHHSFLGKEKDSRLEFLISLKKVLGSSGSIVVYNASFEKNVLLKLAVVFPEYKEWVDSVILRLVDLLEVFRSFYYYNCEQEGSASIKKVLPAVTGNSYSELNINNGKDASLLFFEIMFKDGKKKDKIRKDLEEYCGLDTLGMKLILDELKEIVL